MMNILHLRILFLLQTILKMKKEYYALDIGSGSGYLTKLLCNNFSLVVGTDINYECITKSKFLQNR